MKLPVYLDYQATTPVDPRVVDAMMPYLRDKFGNIGSAHMCGRDVVGPVAIARQQIASLIGANAKDIIFTSGATESDNLAIKGAAFALKHVGLHIITQNTEHKAVLDTCAFLETQGFEVTYLEVDRFGKVSKEQLEKNIRLGEKGTRNRTILASIMSANNEIGTIQPIQEFGKLLRSHGIIFHVDAAQSVGKIAFDVNDSFIDLASISAHKMYGPKGVGCLYVRPGVNLECQMHGGGQECGIRSGTLAVPMVVALGYAAKLAKEELGAEILANQKLRNRLRDAIYSAIDGVRLNGHPEDRLPGNLNLTFERVDGEMLMLGLNQVCCSATSACSASSPKPSHVLKAIGLNDIDALASVRIGIGRFTTEEEIDFAATRIIESVKYLRK